MNPRFVIAHSWFTGFRALKSTYPGLINSLGFPLSLLFIVGVLSSGALLPYALAGGLMTVFTASAIYLVGDLGLFKFETMFKDLVVATRTTPIDYMLGVTIASLLWSSPAIILFFILDMAYRLLTPFNFVMTLIIGCLVLLSIASIAFVVSSFVKHIRNVWAISGILNMLFTVLPPTFYPYKYLPQPILWAMMVLPTTNAAVLEQGLFGLAPVIWQSFAILVAETVILFFVARRFTVWRER